MFELRYYKQSLIGNVTAWYSLFLNQTVFQELHLISFLNAKQTNDGIFLNMTGENFNLANNFWNVRVRL